MTVDVRAKQWGPVFSDADSDADLACIERHRRRTILFREPLNQKVARVARETARFLDPRHFPNLFQDLEAATRDLPEVAGLPDPDAARTDGFCGAARDVSPTLLMEAYARGLLTHAHFGGARWWAPASRWALHPGEAGVPKPVRGHLRRRDVSLHFDTAFEDILVRSTRADTHRFNPRLLDAFAGLHDLGFAHSFEVRDADGVLKAGGFGVSVGRLFVTEGTFGQVPHMLDAGVVLLNRHLAAWGYRLHDAGPRPAFARYGFRAVDRAAYSHDVIGLLGGGVCGRWNVDPGLCGTGVPGRSAVLRGWALPTYSTGLSAAAM